MGEAEVTLVDVYKDCIMYTIPFMMEDESKRSDIIVYGFDVRIVIR